MRCLLRMQPFEGEITKISEGKQWFEEEEITI
jgi:hypothetical protein